ncbi:MAG: 3-hydroxyacyl-CoA dehydrogenase NAD-binding domain-containing protein [Burkholderiales bacterium]
MSAAEYSVHGPVAVIAFNNPPMNTLAHAMRVAVLEQLQQALGDAAVKAIVLIGGGRAFSSGAEIREFNTPKAVASPNVRELIAMIEAAPKPVIAAIHGVAMGGGLELAMGCHYRVVSPGAQLALPEVKLGLSPGASGTQRLPRLIGVEAALNMIVSGNTVASDKLADTALIDELVQGELLAGALAFAGRLLAANKPIRRVRDIRIDYPHHEAFFQFARNSVAAVTRNFPAPLKCVEAVAASVTLPFDEGQKFERQCFDTLVQTTESKALRHAFFGERAAAKIPDVPEDTPLRPIQSAAVIGAGTMGGGIAMNFANAGIPVTLLETKQEALDRGLATVHRNYEGSLKKGRLTQADLDKRLGRIHGTLSYDDIRDADMVIEAVFEDMGVKEQVFRKLDEVMKPGAILATNTSTLDVNRIAAFTRRPQDVIGTHFFSPANVMKLLEIVRGAKTAKDVLATTLALSKKLRKTGVVSGVCDGFIGNRMIEQYSRQAGFLLEEGCLPAQVDRAIERFGFAMGPFRMSDLAGNDVGWYIRKRRYAEHPGMVYSKIPDLVCELGRFGQKTGAGFYDYKPGERSARPSKLIDDLVVKHSKDIGVERRAIGDEEIVERLLFALVNEGARILEEGIALRASDIDMVYLAGYGFPLWRGGPMFYADTVGLPRVVDAINRYARGRHGDFWRPAPLLAKLAAEGKTFN